ncbi:Cytochrome b562 (Cytochrome b-562) [Rubellimicrobium mesophilum DSM 19309]|uniref:Cytochrome b562 (Cytochrome b-562) n=1 Tax=Rubellimicrobium mesophilum DSM 19309 TaxID=442562 RepID=A0A017HT98_9RHOB|nr:cytochrome b/b6 domain-containing protein [Rubellimicrobium mesophilum]EYD77591.1 Cytochrome b562 (Cytochrome b-562) [Rubellimicrobium mesophilum DSM 19309]
MTTTPTSPTERAAHARHGYSSTQIAVHWLVAALVIVNWLLGDGMSDVFRAVEEGQAVNNIGPAYIHIAIGVTVLLLMLFRLMARIRRPVQTDPDDPHRILAVLGAINHWAFYALLILIPVGGAIAWFGRSEEAGDLHELLVNVTLVLVLIHVAAALFHQFVLRDGLIRRMLRPTGGT